MGKIAFLFPGQGSQNAGMGKELAESHTNIKSIFDKADEKLGFKLSKIIFEGPQEELTLTKNAQPALLTTSIALLEFFRNSNVKPDYVAGHSLGEYTALVAAGALSFEDGVYAVRRRGEFMEAAVPNGEGAMAAVLGADRDKLVSLTEAISLEGYAVQLANLNCPGQIVISGSRKGIELASERAKEAGAKRVIPLDVSGPFHSSLMRPAAEQLSEVLDSIDLRNASTPIIANVNAEPMTAAEEMKLNLIRQLYSPVLWEDCINTMIEHGVDTFVEIGPGKVLSGLVKKIDRSVKTYSVFDEESCMTVAKELKGGEAL